MYSLIENASPRKLKASDRRKELRFEVRINANIAYNGFLKNAQITNLSFGGVRIKTELGLMPGDQITVTTLNGRDYPGKVIWSLYPRAGIVFTERLELNDPMIEKYIGVDRILSGGLLDPMVA